MNEIWVKLLGAKNLIYEKLPINNFEFIIPNSLLLLISSD
jgi:hypothetical protein